MLLNTSEYKHLLAGLMVDAAQDALAFGKIVDIGKNEFNLKDLDLEDFVKSIVGELLEQDMQIVKAAPTNSELLWLRHPDYILPKKEAIVKLINLWKTADDYDFLVWFIPPQNLKDKPNNR